MCQLLALAFNQPVTPELSFRGFRHRADDNPDGWGLAFFKGSRATIIKEAATAKESEIVEAILETRHVSSRIFIGHVRRRSVGDVSVQNTHPFKKIVQGKDLVLAHNGTLDEKALKQLTTGTSSREGSTDSELALCVLVDWLVKENCALTDFRAIHDQLRTLNDHGKMNFLFSEGEHLFAYRDANGYNGLFWTHRESPFSRVTLCDEDWTANLPEEKSPSQRGYVIATEPLTDGEKWTDFGHGQLLVFREGRIVYGE